MKTTAHALVRRMGIMMTILSLQFCHTEKKQRIALASPFQQVNVNCHHFSFDSDRAQSLKLPSGTTIKVPSQAFVDKQHKPIKGKVSVKYREFHSAEDVIVSGLPMTYDSAGKHMNFQSAGMFEINATSANGEQVFLAPSKNITLDMASFREGKFNFYYLDSVSGNWKYLGDARAQDNPNKEALRIKMEEIEARQPVMLKKSNDNTPKLDIEINYRQYPDLAIFDNIVWEYAGKEEAMNPEKNEWIYKEQWNYVSLEPYMKEKNEFLVVLRSPFGKRFETIVTPALSLGDYKKAKNEFAQKVALYGQMKAKIEAEQDRAMNEANLVRSFSIANLGVYNCDRQMKQEGLLTMNAQFELDKEGAGVDMDKLSVFLVINDRDVIRYYPGQWSNFSIGTGDRNKLVIVLPGNKVAIFGNDDFAKVNYDALSNMTTPSYTFKMRTISRQVGSVTDLQKILTSI